MIKQVPINLARLGTVLVLVMASFAFARPGVKQGESKRPRIEGVAHMGIYVGDLQKSRTFYKELLGFDEPYDLKRSDGSDEVAFIKVNDDQYIELYTDPPKQDGQVNNVGFYTDNIYGMRSYLASRGVKVPEEIAKDRLGNSLFKFADPDGHIVEFVHYEPDSVTRNNTGKFMPDTRISNRIIHAGILVGSYSASMRLYRDMLGFHEFWRGSSSGVILNWVDLRLPESDDYFEFTLYTSLPDAKHRGQHNHICLGVSDIDRTIAKLDSRPVLKAFGDITPVRTGFNHKRQASLYDPDGTRILLMEFDTVDGKPAPSSTAPPPK